MSFKDKFSNWINSSDEGYVDAPDDSLDDLENPFAEDVTPEPAPRNPIFPGGKKDRNSGNVVSINGPKSTASPRPKVVFQQIDSFAEVTKVADVLKDKRIVVLNLENCPNTDAQRIIDVLYGVSYANDGDFKKVAGRAYIITPNNVPVTGELGEDLGTAQDIDPEF